MKNKRINPIWYQVSAVLGLIGLFAALWLWTPLRDAVDLTLISTWLAPHRHAWYALPLVAVAYVALGLTMVPVLLLVAATGVAFGPWLGPVYAMAGCLASASAGFAIGRWTGLQRIQRVGGQRVTQVSRALERNGTLAVFILRKVPAPFMLSNIVAGASRIRYRDFMVGTALGMGAFVVALAGFGYQLTQAVQDPSPAKAIGAGIFLGVPLTIAWFINRTLRRRRDLGAA